MQHRHGKHVTSIVSGCGYKRTVAELEAQEAWDKFALEAPDGP